MKRKLDVERAKTMNQALSRQQRNKPLLTFQNKRTADQIKRIRDSEKEAHQGTLLYHLKRIVGSVIPFRLQLSFPMHSKPTTKPARSYFSSLTPCSMINFLLFVIAVVWFAVSRMG